MQAKHYNSLDNSLEAIVDLFYRDTLTSLTNVLSDDLKDPQYSAITCVNNIWYYIESGYSITIQVDSIKGFLKSVGFADESFELLLQLWNVEQIYYVGSIIGDCNRLIAPITSKESIEYIILWCKGLVSAQFEKCIGKKATKKEKIELTKLFIAYNNCLPIIGESQYQDIDDYLIKIMPADFFENRSNTVNTRDDVNESVND